MKGEKIQREESNATCREVANQAKNPKGYNSNA